MNVILKKKILTPEGVEYPKETVAYLKGSLMDSQKGDQFYLSVNGGEMFMADSCDVTFEKPRIKIISD